MLRSRQTFAKTASFWIVCLVIFFWLSTRSKPTVNIIANATRSFKYHINVVLHILLSGDIATNPGPATYSGAKDNSTFLWFKVLYLNARSLKALVYSVGNQSEKICKITLLQQLKYGGNCNVVCVCETWLNNLVQSSEILSSYGSILRRDIIGRIGGGVLVAVKADIQVTRRHDLEPDNTELIVTELMKSNNKPVIPYTFYRPPDSKPEVYHQINESIQNNSESSRIIMVGDFNLPSIKWSSDQSAPVSTGDLVDDNFFDQYILGPTLIAGNKLDLLLCNSREIIGEVSTFHPQTCDYLTDYYIVEFEVKLKFKRAKPVKRRVFDYRKGNFDELRNFQTQTPINLNTAHSTDDDCKHW